MATGASIGLPAEDRTRGVGGRHGQMRPGPGRGSPGRKNALLRAQSGRSHRPDYTKSEGGGCSGPSAGTNAVFASPSKALSGFPFLGKERQELRRVSERPFGQGAPPLILMLLLDHKPSSK